MATLTWVGILLCLSQSAVLSGLNLAFFSLSKLELEIGAKKGDKRALRMLALRRDANFALVTILWGNVAVNVLLALLSGSVLSGVAAFLFSTVVITLFAEIAPQAYFSRNALPVGAALSPVLRLYQLVLFPIAKPTALVLDNWLGPEAVRFFPERDLREVIKLHMASSETDIARMEGQGALNFLELDDVPFAEEGEEVDPRSVVRLPFENDRPEFPSIEPHGTDEFLRRLHSSGKKWIVVVDDREEPRLLINSDELIRDAIFNPASFNPYRHCHRPIVTQREHAKLGELLQRLTVVPRHGEDDVVEYDVILLWGDQKRVITGSDILGRLLRGISRRATPRSRAAPA